MAPYWVLPRFVWAVAILLSLLAAYGLCSIAHGQCGYDFAYGYHLPGTSDTVSALIAFDDGSGQAMYAGGWFMTAGDRHTPYIARRDGTGWSNVGEGLNNGVTCFAIFDDGGGPALYAGGNFTFSGNTAINRVAKWDGKQWTPLGSGTNDDVWALAVFDDGTGPALYAAGTFTQAGGISANHVAKWNGKTWTNLGSGVLGSSPVKALCSFDDDGPGPHSPELYIGGGLLHVGNIITQGIAKWNGSSWSKVGNGISIPGEVLDTIDCLTVFDEDGAGPAVPVLFAGGNFWIIAVEAVNIARWNGSTWSQVVTTGSAATHILSMFPVDNPGAGLSGLVLAGNNMWQFGWSYRKVAMWTGTEVIPICNDSGSLENDEARALCIFDDGAGPRLFVGGDFDHAGNHQVRNLAALHDSQWEPVDEGLGLSAGTLTTVDLGDGPHVYARHGTLVSRLENATWVPVGNGLPAKGPCLELFDLGDPVGPTLYTTSGGKAYRLIDDTWQLVVQQPSALIELLIMHHDGQTPALYGTKGAASASQLVKYDLKSSSFAYVGPILHGGAIRTVAEFDDGSGDGLQLYAAGTFNFLQSGTSIKRIARWTGDTWAEVGGGVTQPIAGASIHDMQVLDDGTGPALYVGGFFQAIGGVPAQNVAKWDGKTWSALGEGVPGTSTNASVRMLTVFDDGSGPALYASGQSLSGGLFKWTGSTWQKVAGGFHSTSEWASHGAAIQDESGPTLFMGGQFTSVDGVPSTNIAKYELTTDSPVMQSQPFNRSVFIGQNAAFSAIAWGGEISYQWRKDGVALIDNSHVSGAQSTTLTIVQAVGADGGSYALQLMSECGTTLSAPATLTVNCQFDIVPNANVDVDDLLAVINNWGLCQPEGACSADIAPPGPPLGNGSVNLDDLLAVINAWGECN